MEVGWHGSGSSIKSSWTEKGGKDGSPGSAVKVRRAGDGLRRCGPDVRISGEVPGPRAEDSGRRKDGLRRWLYGLQWRRHLAPRARHDGEPFSRLRKSPTLSAEHLSGD